MEDNVPEDTKKRRLQEVIDCFRYHVQKKNEEQELGRLRLVLVEGEAKRSKPGARSWSGRTDKNKRIVFPSEEGTCSAFSETALRPVLQAIHKGFPPASVDWGSKTRVEIRPGDYAIVEVTEVKGHGLRGKLLCRSSILEFSESGLSKVDPTSLRSMRLVSEAFCHGENPHGPNAGGPALEGGLLQ